MITLTKSALQNTYKDLLNMAISDYSKWAHLDIFSSYKKNKSNDTYYIYRVIDDKVYHAKLLNDNYYNPSIYFEDELFLYDTLEEKLNYILMLYDYYLHKYASPLDRAEQLNFYTKTGFKNITEYVKDFYDSLEYNNKYQTSILRKIAVKTINVSLRPSLSVVKKRNVINYILKLKIGIDKFYIVKDIHQFIDNIKNQRNVKYGANLEFYHSINCFNKVDSVIIKEYDGSFYSEKNALYISFDYFYKILVAYKELGLEINYINNSKDYNLYYNGFKKLSGFIKYKKTLILNSKAHDLFILNNKTVFKISEDGIFSLDLDNQSLTIISELVLNKVVVVNEFNKEIIDNLYKSHPNLFI